MPDTVIVFAGGDPIPPSAVADLPEDAYVVAADSGLDRARELGFEVDLLVGDLDSISSDGRQQAEAHGTRIERHPVYKDATDMELALKAARRQGARRVIVIMRHEKRKLPMAVAHLTSPGFPGGKSREALGLRGGGPSRVITDKAILGFDPATRGPVVLSVHPGVSVDEVREHTGFQLAAPATVPETPLPTAEELRLLREEIDPRRVYLR